MFSTKLTTLFQTNHFDSFYSIFQKYMLQWERVYFISLIDFYVAIKDKFGCRKPPNKKI